MAEPRAVLDEKGLPDPPRIVARHRDRHLVALPGESTIGVAEQRAAGYLPPPAAAPPATTPAAIALASLAMPSELSACSPASRSSRTASASGCWASSHRSTRHASVTVGRAPPRP